MDIRTILKVGETVSKEYIVREMDTADYLGNKGVAVLSTPAMIAYMELAASSIIFERVPENYRPVGTKIDIKHINPAPLGGKITVNGVVTDINGRKATFNVEVLNGKNKIGYGEYGVHVVDLNKFKNKF